MILGCIFFLFVLSRSEDVICENLEITTTLDTPGNVMSSGKYNPIWYQTPFKSFMDSEKLTFFIKGLPDIDSISNTYFTLSHEDNENSLKSRWVKAEVSKVYKLDNLPQILAVEVIQECLVRDGWRALNMSLNINSGNCQKIEWPRACGNPTRALSSFNMGFNEFSSELMKGGVVVNEMFDVSAGKLDGKTGKYNGELYIWSSFIEDLDVKINVSYIVVDKEMKKRTTKEIKGQLHNNTFKLQIDFSCSSSQPGSKTIYLSLSLVHLHNFILSYQFTCPSSPSSSSFKTFIILLLLLSLLLLILLLSLRFHSSISSLLSSTFQSSILKPSYTYSEELPDREFPDTSFNDLTFKSSSQAYGTI